MICPYCNEPAQWVENNKIYGKNYGKSYMIWYCQKDDAYVGCHQNTREPLGTMADKELREWRQKAHLAFDPFWEKWGLKRQEAYQMLKTKFGKEIHIGETDIEMCKEIITFCELSPKEKEEDNDCP